MSKTVSNKKMLSTKDEPGDELTKTNERIKDKYCNSCILIQCMNRTAQLCIKRSYESRWGA